MNRIDANELQMDSKGRVRKSFSPVRLLGNLLILGGLALLLGIGAWQGYMWLDTNQQRSELKANGVIEQPTITPGVSVADASDGTPAPLPTAQPAPPPPNLNPAGTTAADWTTLLKQQLVDNSPTTHISIPSVAIDSKIVPIDWKMIPTKNGAGAKSEWQVADYAVGHHAGTANPGQLGNVVLSGHDDYRGEVFKNLHNVKKGDEVIVDTEKGQYIYIVTQLVLVTEEGVSDAQKADNAKYMNPTPDQTLTMITCFPYGIDNQRFIAIAKPYQPVQTTFSEFFIR